MYLYETHCHTAPVSACAIDTPEVMVRAYKQLGYAGIIITDHFFNGNFGGNRKMTWDEKVAFLLSGYEAAKLEGDAIGLDVFFGWEYNVQGAEFLTYGLDEAFLYAHPGMDALNVAEYSALIRRHGGYLAQAHPFRNGSWIVRPQPVDPALMDGIEAYNGERSKDVNLKAYAFAKKHGIPMQSGSDAHSVSQCGSGGIILSEKARDIHDIIAAIKTGNAKLISSL